MPDTLVPLEEKRDVHLLDYWRILWRGRWTILSIFVVVVTLVAIGTLTQKPGYRAQATVEISPQSRKGSPVAEVYVDRNRDQAVEATSRAVRALLSEIAPLREKLEDTQRSTFEFAERANLYVPENQQKITNDRLSTLQAGLTETQVKRGELEGLLKQIDSVRLSQDRKSVV